MHTAVVFIVVVHHAGLQFGECCLHVVDFFDELWNNCWFCVTALVNSLMRWFAFSNFLLSKSFVSALCFATMWMMSLIMCAYTACSTVLLENLRIV